MKELQPGSVIICGDLMGILRESTKDTVILQTLMGDKTVKRDCCTVMATPQEIAQQTCMWIGKKVNHAI